VYQEKISSFCTHFSNIPVYHHSTVFIYGLVSISFSGLMIRFLRVAPVIG